MRGGRGGVRGEERKGGGSVSGEGSRVKESSESVQRGK